MTRCCGTCEFFVRKSMEPNECLLFSTRIAVHADGGVKCLAWKQDTETRALSAIVEECCV